MVMTMKFSKHHDRTKEMQVKEIIKYNINGDDYESMNPSRLLGCRFCES